MTFDVMMQRILGHEAGYVNDPSDPGGETKWGISKRSYPSLPIASLSQADAVEIYRRDFWKPLEGERLAPSVAYQLLDAAVNSGIQPAIRFLQRALGVADDGNFGPRSLAASKEVSETDQLMLFVAERLEYMTKLKNWPDHGKGWVRRMCLNLRYAAQDS